ncbi:MAG TPA: hypothetical protein VG101_11660, partial [Puia sp.]|nr:hypothetical protein [Puia sp.]
MKLNKLGRIGLIVTWFTLTALDLSAQSGGYSYLEFVENKGQWDSSVRLKAEMPAGYLYMQHKGFTVLLADTNDMVRIGELLHGDFARAGVAAPNYANHPGGGWATGPGGVSGGAGKAAVGGTAVSPGATSSGSKQILPPGNGGGGVGQGGGGGSGGANGSGGTGGAGGKAGAADPWLMHMHSYRVSFVGANDEVQILPDKAVASYNNYFIGDRKNWATRCRIYQGILYKDMYKGIDIHYYTDAGTLKYDIVVHPGADPGQVILQYDGQTKLSVRKNKVYVQTTVGTVQELEPHSYQVNASGR